MKLKVLKKCMDIPGMPENVMKRTWKKLNWVERTAVKKYGLIKVLEMERAKREEKLEK